VEELWRHSVAAAVSASVVEQEQDGEAKAAAFTAGLLRDIGRLVFASTEQESYAKLIQRARDQGVPLFSMERSVLGIDHAELGGELLRRWELPPDIVAAVAHHHNFEAGPRYEHLTAIVQVGEMIGDRLLDRDLADTGLLTGSSATLETLQLTPDDFPHLVAKAQAEMDKVQGMLGI
jgi:putative nucleotidyltransferase with HDIG domain